MRLAQSGTPKVPAQRYLEVVLISILAFSRAVGRYSWHEERKHRALAHSTLRNFADELQGEPARPSEANANTTKPSLASCMNSLSATNRRPKAAPEGVQFKGVRPIIFEHTAWDLALATQAFSYLKPRAGFQISLKVIPPKVPSDSGEQLSRIRLYSATFSSDNVKGSSLQWNTIPWISTQKEPAILQLYDEVIPGSIRLFRHLILVRRSCYRFSNLTR